MTEDARRRIPAVETLLGSEAFRGLLRTTGRDRVATVLRAVQDELRRSCAAEAVDVPEAAEWYADQTSERLERQARRSLRGVMNATGVVLHTNLGRAPLADIAIEAVVEAAGYSSLEMDLESGARGSRYDHCAQLLRELTGAEAALVVNNNAAAVVLVLNTLAEDRDTLISRGELVEIGGSFRVPDIMAKSGTRMVEVGATNRTHLRDFSAAVTSDTAVILKVHRSNFRMEGFTADVEVGALAGLARQAGVPLVHDLGSGALLDLTSIGLPHETTAAEALGEGADVVTMSGDKLLGGPQAGIVVGRGALIERMRSNPLSRALRPDKLTLAGLEATLALYREPERALREIPTLRMLAADPAELSRRADALAARLKEAGLDAEVVDSPAAVGGGAYPGVQLPGRSVAVSAASGAEAVAARLRDGSPPVIGRVRESRLLLDLRTIPEDREDALVHAVMAAVRG